MGKTLHHGPLTDEQRDLAAQHFPLAMSIANRWIKRCPYLRNELTSAAHMGLVDAARAHKPGHPQPFKALVRKCVDTRIFGAFQNSDRQRHRDRRFMEHFAIWGVHWYCHPASAEESFPGWLGSLPEAQREVLWLRYAMDMKPQEIARHLGRGIGCVKTRLCRALASARTFF